MSDAIEALLKRRRELDAKGAVAAELLTSAKSLIEKRQADVDANKTALGEVDAALKKLGYQPSEQVAKVADAKVAEPKSDQPKG